MKKLKLQITIE